MKSAFEKEIFSALIRFRYWLQAHDRGVIIGLILAIPPIPPVPLLGLGLSLFNYVLWKRNRLGNHEISLIRIALLVSLISTTLAATLVYVVADFIFSPATNSIVGDIATLVIEKLRHLLYHLLPFNNRVEVTL